MMCYPSIQAALRDIGVFTENTVGFFAYGSRVYGVERTKTSDEDLILVNRNAKTDESKLDFGVFDINIFSEIKFKQMLDEHEISALECLFLPPPFSMLNELQYEFKLDLPKLRKAISHKSSNSFVKCKKKLEVEHEYHIGRKSLWHSLRMLMFGTQIAKHGRIVNYGEANKFWKEIVLSDREDWQYFKEKYQPIFNELSTEFRKVAPKI